MPPLNSLYSPCPPCLLRRRKAIALPLALAALMALFASGCGGSSKPAEDFTTSGSREADQRAEQRMAKSEQLSGQGQNAGQGGQKAKPVLYTRLGEEKG